MNALLKTSSEQSTEQTNGFQLSVLMFWLKLIDYKLYTMGHSMDQTIQTQTIRVPNYKRQDEFLVESFSNGLVHFAWNFSWQN